MTSSNRRHPFFDAPTYPWRRADGVTAHKALVDAISSPGRIDLLYKQSGGVGSLSLAQEPTLIWKDALERLTVAKRLETLVSLVIADGEYVNIRGEMRAIVDATDPEEHVTSRTADFDDSNSMTQAPPSGRAAVGRLRSTNGYDAVSKQVVAVARSDSIALKTHFLFLANSDIRVYRSYLEAKLVNDSFTFNAFSDTGTPHDPLVWIVRERRRIPGAVGPGFIRHNERKHTFTCTAEFEHQAKQAPHHIVTKYRWKGAGVLSRAALEQVPTEAKGFLYSRFLEHVSVKCPPGEPINALDISVNLPREWAPDDSDLVKVYTKLQSNPAADPEFSDELTREVFYDGEGYFSLRVHEPEPGRTYILAWPPRDRSRE
jgi:hypothetical protein